MEDDVTNNQQSISNLRVWSAAEVISVPEFQLEFSQDPVLNGSAFQLRFKLVNIQVTEDFDNFPVTLNVPAGLTLTGAALQYYNMPAGYNQYIYRDLTAGATPGLYTVELVGGNNEVIDSETIEVI